MWRQPTNAMAVPIINESRTVVDANDYEKSQQHHHFIIRMRMASNNRNAVRIDLLNNNILSFYIYSDSSDDDIREAIATATDVKTVIIRRHSSRRQLQRERATKTAAALNHRRGILNFDICTAFTPITQHSVAVLNLVSPIILFVLSFV